MEDEVWKAYRLGSQEAYLKLFDTYYPGLSAYGNRLQNSKQYTDDAVQELFMELWDRRHRVPEVLQVKAYLFKALKRKMLKANASLHTELDGLEGELLASNIEASIIEREQTDAVLASLEKACLSLTPRQREIIHLRFYEGLDYQEIADISAIGVSRVYNLMYEAMKRLKEFMEEHHLTLFLCLIISWL